MKMKSSELLNMPLKKSSTPAISRGCMIVGSVKGDQVKNLDNDGGRKGHEVIKKHMEKNPW